MTTTPPVPAKRTGYHHGNLVEALLEAAIALIDEKGVDALSVREVARKAGVSPGAPFRLQDENIVNLTKQFSVYGYVAAYSEFPEGLVPIVPAS